MRMRSTRRTSSVEAIDELTDGAFHRPSAHSRALSRIDSVSQSLSRAEAETRLFPRRSRVGRFPEPRATRPAYPHAPPHDPPRKSLTRLRNGRRYHVYGRRQARPRRLLQVRLQGVPRLRGGAQEGGRRPRHPPGTNARSRAPIALRRPRPRPGRRERARARDRARTRSARAAPRAARTRPPPARDRAARAPRTRANRWHAKTEPRGHREPGSRDIPTIAAKQTRSEELA